jgi:hypothetical protein
MESKRRMKTDISCTYFLLGASALTATMVSSYKFLENSSIATGPSTLVAVENVRSNNAQFR